MKKNRGLFITFEGIDGCGKSTQIFSLEKYLSDRKLPFVLSREPGGTPVGNKIREILKEEKMDSFTNLFLFLASRVELVSEIIIPYLNNGFFVVLDRFTDSTLAYQGYGQDINLTTINKLNKIASKNIIPDVTFLLDLPVDIALSRLDIRRESIRKFEKTELLEKVRKGYLLLAEENPKRIKVIDAHQSIEKVHKDIVSKLENIF